MSSSRLWPPSSCVSLVTLCSTAGGSLTSSTQCHAPWLGLMWCLQALLSLVSWVFAVFGKLGICCLLSLVSWVFVVFDKLGARNPPRAVAAASALMFNVL